MTGYNFCKRSQVQNFRVQNYLDSKDLFAMIIDPEGVVIAHPDESKLRDILRGSSDGFIQKQFDVKILSGKIKQILK